MAITYDAVSSANLGTSAGPTTWNHTTGATATKLVAGICLVDTTGGGPAAVTALTFDGQSLTFVKREVGNSNAAEIWYLDNPPIGTLLMSITFDHAPNIVAFGSGVSLNGTFPGVESSNSGNGGAGTSSVSVTMVTNNAWIVDVIASNNPDNLVPQGSQVERWSIITAGRSGQGSTLGPVVSPGVTSMQWQTVTSNWVSAAAAFAGEGTPITGLGRKHQGFIYARPYL